MHCQTQDKDARSIHCKGDRIKKYYTPVLITANADGINTGEVQVYTK
jgi:hypothetical protein